MPSTPTLGEGGNTDVPHGGGYLSIVGGTDHEVATQVKQLVGEKKERQEGWERITEDENINMSPDDVIFDPEHISIKGVGVFGYHDAGYYENSSYLQGKTGTISLGVWEKLQEMTAGWNNIQREHFFFHVLRLGHTSDAYLGSIKHTQYLTQQSSGELSVVNIMPDGIKIKAHNSENDNGRYQLRLVA